MKRQFICLIVIVCACAATAFAQNRQEVVPQVVTHIRQVANDSIQRAGDGAVQGLKMKALLNKERVLKEKIKEEDGKRNAVYNEVSPETREALNDRQDSICLDLRSQLVDVQLEILEMKRTNLLHTVTLIKPED